MKLRRGIFILLWMLSLLGISFYGGAISYGLFWGLSLVPVVSMLYICMVMLQFRIYQEIKSRSIMCKQPMPYYFILRNETFYGFSSVSVRLFSELSYVTDMADGEEYELLPGEEYVYHTQMICKYRGEYEVGVKEVIITDVFRLFRVRYKLPSTIKALVYPRILYKEELNSIQDVMAISSLDTPYNQVELDVLTREYIPGDALKRIHWKAFAREQKLKTRNLLGDRRQEIVLIYDTKRYSKDMHTYLPLENQILEVLLALGVFLARKNISYTVYWGQGGIRQCKVEGLHQFELLYQETSHTLFGEKEDIEILLQQLIEHGMVYNSRTCILVLHEWINSVFSKLQLLAEKGIEVVVYLVTDKNVDNYVRQSHSRLKIIALPIEGDLEELL